MEVLIDPSLKFSDNEAWTGLIGIITSHISFHYWTEENYLQLDIYSCKEFDIGKTRMFLSNFWKSSEEKILFIERNAGEEFKIERM
jgi:S-adenosylmethionine/arginine decarboxylase-like enzyme